VLFNRQSGTKRLFLVNPYDGMGIAYIYGLKIILSCHFTRSINFIYERYITSIKYTLTRFSLYNQSAIRSEAEDDTLDDIIRKRELYPFAKIVVRAFHSRITLVKSPLLTCW